MARVGFTNFGTAAIAIDSLGGQLTLPSAFSYDTGVVFGSAARSLKLIAPSGSAAGTITGLANTSSATFARMRIRVTALPATTARVIAGIVNTSRVNLRLNPDGTIAYYDGTTLVGTSTTALTDTSRWYTIRFRSGGTATPLLYIDSSLEVTGNGASTALGNPSIGANDTVADTYTLYFADLSCDDAAFPGETDVVALVLPASDNSVGSGWTDSGGSSSNLFQSVDNTPPTGIADTTSNAGHQIRNASSSAAAYAANLTTYSAAGLGASDTVNAVRAFVVTGAPVATGAKTGSLTIANPTLAAASFANFHSGTNAGTYPTGWKNNFSAIVSAPSVTIANAPVLTVTITGGTASRIALACDLGMFVDYTPAATNVTVNAGKGSLIATGLAPKAVIDNRVFPGVGALSATGLAPKAVIGNIVRPAVGALVAAGLAATVAISNNQRVTPAVGTVTATGFAPTVAVSNNQRVAPSTGTLTVTGFAPSVAVSNNQRVLPGVGAVAASGFAPSIVLGIRVSPSVGSLAATGFAALAVATANQFVRAGVGALSATGFAPTIAVSDHQRVLASTGSLDAAGFSATVTATANQFARAGTGSLTATGYAPSLALAIHAGVGSLTATGYAPTVNVIVGAIQPGTGQLSAAGFAPTVTATANLVVRPSPGELSVAGFAPAVAVSNNQRVFAGTGTATLTGFAPTAHASDNQTVAPSTGEVVATGYAPSVTIAIRVAPATGQLVATGFAPSIALSDNQRVTAGVGALAAEGFSPIVVAPRAVQAATGQLVATAYAPTVFASDQQIVLPGTAALTVEGFAPAITIVLGTWVVVSALERVDATYRLERVDAALVLSRTEPALALSRSEAVAELARLDDVSPLTLVRAPLALTPDVPTFVLSLVTTDD